MSFDVDLTNKMKTVIADRDYTLVSECDNYVAVRLIERQHVKLLDLQFFRDNGLHCRSIEMGVVVLEKIK